MPDGGQRNYGTVSAAETKTISTYDGHAWVLQDSEGEAIAAFVASSSKELAVIDSATRKPEPDRGHRRGRQRQTQRSIAPDGRFRVAIENENVVVIDTDDDSHRLLTDDGSAEDGYGGRVWWSPDSRHFVVMKTRPGLHRSINDGRVFAG